jgi:hypothetical protein
MPLPQLAILRMMQADEAGDPIRVGIFDELIHDPPILLEQAVYL